MENTMTKREKFNLMKDALVGDLVLKEDEKNELIDFCVKEINLLDEKAEKAKERAKKKKAEPDLLLDAVKMVLEDNDTEDFMITASIVKAIEDVDSKLEFTTAKVSSRLTKLVKEGFAEKKEVKVNDGEGKKSRRVMGYRKRVESDEESAE